jgi:hypothetical protein
MGTIHDKNWQRIKWIIGGGFVFLIIFLAIGANVSDNKWIVAIIGGFIYIIWTVCCVGFIQ